MFISAGHSNSDPGAVANGKTEADIAVEFRNIVSFYLQQFQVPHVLDGNGTVNLPLTSAAKTAKGHKVAVEFHCNASDNPKATGVEVLCGKDADDNLLAKKIAAALSAGLGIANRGVKPENSGQHKRLAFVQAGGLIVELFFITKKTDLAAYEANKWVVGREIARVLAAA